MAMKFTPLYSDSIVKTNNGLVFKELTTTEIYYAPTVYPESPQGIIIYENEMNGNRTVSYNIYDTDNTRIDNVLKTTDGTSWGGTTYCCVKAVDANGIESQVSDWVSPATCFVAGTAVLMADNTYKMIEEIAAGEQVKSYNFKTNAYCVGTVSEAVVGTTNRLAMVTYSNSTYVVMSEGHPLYTEDGWHSITNKNGYPTLEVGDKVLTGSSNYLEITDIQIIETEGTSVYSLAVTIDYKDEVLEGTYFAGLGSMTMATHI